MSRSTTIRIEPEEGDLVEIHAEGGTRVLSEVLSAHGFPLNTRCGQRGLCRGCEVHVRDGEVMLDNQTTVKAPVRVQACRASLHGPLTIGLPLRSRLDHHPAVGDTFEVGVPFSLDPLYLATDSCDTAFAADIGTTTVAVLLVDLRTGEVLSRAGGFNAQIRFGDNVLTRIDAARERDVLVAMQAAVVKETLEVLLIEACKRASREPDRIAGGTIAGNTTMLHLLVGEDPTSLGIAPFTPGFLAGRKITAAAIHLNAAVLAPETPIQLLPGIAAYIGADITAGIYATGMLFDDEPSLLVDIGTNGEIVLQRSGQLKACATAAGPAFEGAGLRCGTRARSGAVCDVRIALDPWGVEVKTIGDVRDDRATGICGSAYIDFLATARRCGLIRETGRFDRSAWQHVPQSHRRTDDEELALLLTGSAGPGAPCVSEVDVAVLLQAKAAIGAGIQTLLHSAGIQPSEVARVYLAGGFGMHLNVPNAIEIGLLPGFHPDQIQVVGNTSLAGSLLALLDKTSLAEMQAIRQRTNVVELNLDEDFEDRYIENLMLL